MRLLRDHPALSDHLDHLLTKDAVFADLLGGDYQLPRQQGEAGLPGLIRIVIGQQVSTAAARSLWEKFSNRFDPENPQIIAVANDDDLRACGLSRQKIGYVRGAAQAVMDGTLHPASWQDKDTSTVIEEITALKGFGLWSAHMVLIFNLARPDIWPAGDLGIQKGLQRYLSVDDRPDEKQTLAHQSLFTGKETAAALLLWALTEL